MHTRARSRSVSSGWYVRESSDRGRCLSTMSAMADFNALAALARSQVVSEAQRSSERIGETFRIVASRLIRFLHNAPSLLTRWSVRNCSPCHFWTACPVPPQVLGS